MLCSCSLSHPVLIEEALLARNSGVNKSLAKHSRAITVSLVILKDTPCLSDTRSTHSTPPQIGICFGVDPVLAICGVNVANVRTATQAQFQRFSLTKISRVDEILHGWRI